ncbi:DUF6461 domain-containing protein [Streptomyces sp. NPDC047869]|uniref:DUF6461 domain-containing protein n=1 Tax=Streptomyces sp. NPDC047869 TaxID=3154709 RepID=UPI003454DEEC
MARRPRFLQTLSTGGRAVVHSSNGRKPIHLFHWYEYGGASDFVRRAHGQERHTPNALKPVMHVARGQAAEGGSDQSLENIARPLTAEEADAAWRGEWAPQHERVRLRPADVRQAARGRDQRIANDRTAARRLDHQTADVDAALARAAESLRLNPRGRPAPGARLVLRSGLDAVEHCAVGPRSLCWTFADLRLMNELRRLRASHTEDRPEPRRRRDRTTLGGLLRSLRSGELRGS